MWVCDMFEEYIGRHLAQRHKYIGLKYARVHHYPELISSHTYGICFKNEAKAYLVFRIYFDSVPQYDSGGRNIPGRTIKTISDIELFGEGYTSEEMEEAVEISRGYLKLAVEP